MNSLKHIGGLVGGVALLLMGSSAQGAALTSNEVDQIEVEFGITLTAQEKTDLAALVKPDAPLPQWRIDAESRIEQHRKADLAVQVVDANGIPISNATVNIKLSNHDFKFGGIVRAEDVCSDVNLGITTNRYQELFSKMFNSAGVNNDLKSKWTRPDSSLLAGLFKWTTRENIPVRGHLLLWPGETHLTSTVLAKAEELSAIWDDVYHPGSYSAGDIQQMASITVAAGDVLVAFAVANTGNPVHLTYSGTAVLAAEDYATGGRTHRWVREVQTGGTVQIELNTETACITAVYHLVPDGGNITLLDSMETNHGVVEGFTNQYTFGASASGIVIEAASTYAAMTIPENAVWKSKNVKRMVAHTYFSGVSSLTRTWENIGIESSVSCGVAFANAKVAGEATAGGDEAQLQQELKDMIEAEVAEWASLWPIYEWDVINEANGNNLLQELIGWDQMAEWFKTAQSNVVLPGCGLFLNEYNILSSPPEAEHMKYINTRDMMMRNIDIIQANGGPISGIGFQSRVRPTLGMDELYSRLEEFGTRYGLPMAGTEFEIRNSETNELVRGRVTEEVLTTYLSHPLATGLNAWTYMKDELRSMFYRDGSIKMNGLVWYYLHKIRYTTGETKTSNAQGEASVRAFKGDYDIVVSYNGTDYPATLTLSNNQTQVVSLGDVVLVPNDPPVWGSNSFTLNAAKQGLSYLSWINWRASDPDSDRLTFASVSGPAWLSVARNGKLTGTPEGGDAGTNTFVVSVSDGIAPAVEASMHLYVEAPPVLDPTPVWDLLEEFTLTGGVDGAQLSTVSSTTGTGSALAGAVLNGQDIQGEQIHLYGVGTGSGFGSMTHASYAGATNGIYEISFTMTSADMTVSSASNTTAQAGFGFRFNDGANRDLRTRFRFDASDNFLLSMVTAEGAKTSVIENGPVLSAALTVRQVLDMDAGTYGVYYTLGAASEVQAYNGGVFAGQTLGEFSQQFQTINGGNYMQVGDSFYMDNITLSKQGEPIPPQAYYDAWLWYYPGMENSTNLLDNPDGDLFDNLLEYAQGGDPANGADVGHAPLDIHALEVGGTNFLEYVYAKRNDSEARGLLYSLEISSNLVSNIWITGNGEVLGTGALDAEFDSITNRVPAQGKEGFIRLRIKYR